MLGVKGDVAATAGEALLRAYNDERVNERVNERVIGLKTMVLDFADNCYINSGGMAFLIDMAALSMNKNNGYA